jgi:hypothetical protein
MQKLDGTNVSSFREWAGTQHFMSCLHRTYEFPVHVFKENEDGTRIYLRTEASASA